MGNMSNKDGQPNTSKDIFFGKKDINGCNCIKGVIVNKNNSNRRGFF